MRCFDLEMASHKIYERDKKQGMRLKGCYGLRLTDSN